MNWIQNDNPNVDGVDQHQQQHLLFRFLLHLCFENSEQTVCNSAPYQITMKTLIPRAQIAIAQIYLDFF